MPRKKNKNIQENRLAYKSYSVQQIGSIEYNNVWNSARDSIKLWAFNRLGYNSLYADHPWYLDSLVCFNKNADRCVMAISYQLEEEANHDGMDYLYGAHIQGKWYFFFGGGHFTLPRDYYQSNIHIPLRVDQLNEIALENIFSGYLKKNKEGEWEVNDAFFTAHFESSGWGNFENQNPRDTLPDGKHFTDKREYFESIYLGVAKGNWIKENKQDDKSEE